MFAAGAVSTVARGPVAFILVLTGAVWVILELRQGLTRRSEAVRQVTNASTA